jgi:hypothetical protein
MLKSMGTRHFQNVGLNLATIVVFGPSFWECHRLGALSYTYGTPYIWTIFVKKRKKNNDGNFFL